MSEINLPTNLPGWITDHIRLYLSDPEKAHLWDSTAAGGSGPLPTLLLTSTGRRSGEPRMLPLIYGETDANYVIIASKGGSPSHPAWYLNLVANPDCEIRVGPKNFRARARTAEGAEREKLWEQMAGIYPPYRDYQKRAEGRVIPAVVLDVVDSISTEGALDV